MGLAEEPACSHQNPAKLPDLVQDYYRTSTRLVQKVATYRLDPSDVQLRF
jgi:hypothetical protein